MFCIGNGMFWGEIWETISTQINLNLGSMEHGRMIDEVTKTTSKGR